MCTHCNASEIASAYSHETTFGDAVYATFCGRCGFESHIIVPAV